MGLRSVIFKALTGKSLNDIFPKNEVRLDPPQCSGLEDNYLFDFKNWSSQYNFNTSGNFVIGTPAIGVAMQEDANMVAGIDTTMPGVIFSTEKEQPKHIKVKPIDVLHELETMPTPFTLTLIDEKVQILKDKAKLIVQHYAKREVEALVERMENRKRYLEFKSFFDKYQNTTDEKIASLVRKYEDSLTMKTSDIFIPEFPDEAIRAMTEYTDKCTEICGKKPVFYVIAEHDKFQEAYKKRDPILLVQSPFGFFWQILGAWDKEMLLLSEL